MDTIRDRDVLKEIYKKKMKKCIFCRKKKLVRIVELGKQPLSGIFLDKKNKNLKKYSLDLFKCKTCDLVQLGESAKLENVWIRI